MYTAAQNRQMHDARPWHQPLRGVKPSPHHRRNRHHRHHCVRPPASGLSRLTAPLRRAHRGPAHRPGLRRWASVGAKAGPAYGTPKDGVQVPAGSAHIQAPFRILPEGPRDHQRCSKNARPYAVADLPLYRLHLMRVCVRAGGTRTTRQHTAGSSGRLRVTISTSWCGGADVDVRAIRWFWEVRPGGPHYGREPSR
jgi:hypothetical protein